MSKQLAQPVADQVEGQQQQEDGQRRPQGDVRVDLRLLFVDPFVDHVAPATAWAAATDSPRKASDPSSTMATATAMSPKDTAAGITLGRISRNTIRDVVAPMVRAATTNSRLAKDSVVARTTRKSSGARRRRRR